MVNLFFTSVRCYNLANLLIRAASSQWLFNVANIYFYETTDRVVSLLWTITQLYLPSLRLFNGLTCDWLVVAVAPPPAVVCPPELRLSLAEPSAAPPDWTKHTLIKFTSWWSTHSDPHQQNRRPVSDDEDDEDEGNGPQSRLVFHLRSTLIEALLYWLVLVGDQILYWWLEGWLFFFVSTDINDNFVFFVSFNHCWGGCYISSYQRVSHVYFLPLWAEWEG